MRGYAQIFFSKKVAHLEKSNYDFLTVFFQFLYLSRKLPIASVQKNTKTIKQVFPALADLECLGFESRLDLVFSELISYSKKSGKN